MLRKRGPTYLSIIKLCLSVSEDMDDVTYETFTSSLLAQQYNVNHFLKLPVTILSHYNRTFWKRL